MKLTDTQLVNLKGAAGQKVVAKLLAERLVEEIRARGSLPIWRRDEEDRPMLCHPRIINTVGWALAPGPWCWRLACTSSAKSMESFYGNGRGGER